MTPRQEPWRRWLRRALVGLGIASGLVVSLLVLALGTGAGRAQLLGVLLAQVNGAIPGQLAVRALERLDPFGLTLTGIELRDPTSARVLTLERVHAELAPLALLGGRIELRLLRIGPGYLDLEQLATPGRGVLAALVDPNEPAAPPSNQPPPAIVVDELVLDDLAVRAPALPTPWDPLVLRHIAAHAELSLAPAPSLVLRSLSLEIERGGRQLARVTRAVARLAQPGEASDIELDLELGAARLAARARAVITPQDALVSQPLLAELHVAELTAAELAVVLDDPSQSGAFEGSVSLDAKLSGTLDELALEARLATGGGPLGLRAKLEDRRRLAAHLELMSVVLGRVHAGLPLAPLTLALDTSLELGGPTQVPFELSVSSATLGERALPELRARGTWTGAGATGLELTVARGSSVLRAEGEVETAGALDLKISADVRRAELDELAGAAGLPAGPGGSLQADLRVARGAAGRWLARGSVAARALRLPQLSLERARLDLDVAGLLPLLEGTADVALRGLSLGTLRVPTLAVHFDGSPLAARVRARGELARLHAALDLHAERLDQRWRVQGGASGQYAGTPFELSVEPTTLDPGGSVEVSGMELRAGGQRLSVTGSYGRPGAELVARATRLDVAKLAELAGLGGRWTGDADLGLRLRGSPEQPLLEATLAATGVSPNGEHPIDASLAGVLDAVQGRASLDVALLSAGESRAALALASEFGGGAGWAARVSRARHRMSLDVRDIELGWLETWLARPLPVSGRVNASAALSGSLQEPVVHATLAAQLPAGLGLTSLGVAQRIDYEAGRFGATLAVDDAAGRWLNLDAELELPPEDTHDLTALAAHASQLAERARYSVRLVLARRQLGAVWTEAPTSVAGLVIDGELQASHEAYAEPAGRAALHVSETRAGMSAAGCTDAGVRVALLAALAKGKFSAKLTALSRDTELMRAEARADVQLAPALHGGRADFGALAAELSSRGLVLEQVPFLCQRLRGRVDAQLRLTDALGVAPSASANVAASGLSMGATPSLNLKLEAHADRRRASAEASIIAPTGRSTLSVGLPIDWSRGRLRVAPDAPLEARARLDKLPIAPLLDPAGALSYATGFVSGSVVVGGTLAEPEPRGTLELADAELTATALAQPLHGVKGRFSFTRNTLEIEGFEAKDRDGVLSIAGNVSRSGADAVNVRLDARAKRFPLRQRGQVVATTSGRAKIDATLTDTRSDVAVKLVDVDTWLERAPPRNGIQLDAHPDFVVAKPSGAATPSGTPVPAPASDEPDRESHISIDASDQLWIKRDDFAIQLATRLDAVIEGTQAKIKGRVDIHRGYLDLMGRVFEVERGSRLDFIGSSPPDPVVSITAAYEARGAGKTVKVQIQGRGSKPELKFFIEDVEASAGEALEVMVGGRSSGNEASAKQEATSFVSGLTAGLLATSARRELGAAAPIIMIEPGEQTGDGRIRAGFELDSLVPPALRQLITGIYVEGIVEREGSGHQGSQGQETSTQAGVLLELYFPHQLFSTGQWGPGTTWSLDWGWQL